MTTPLGLPFFSYAFNVRGRNILLQIRSNNFQNTEKYIFLRRSDFVKRRFSIFCSSDISTQVFWEIHRSYISPRKNMGLRYRTQFSRYISSEMAILERSIDFSVIKKERQKFSAISIFALLTHRRFNIPVDKIRTSQRYPGFVIIKRSISELVCVAYMESELTTAIISIPGIHEIKGIYFWLRLKRANSWSLGIFLIPRSWINFSWAWDILIWKVHESLQQYEFREEEYYPEEKQLLLHEIYHIPSV